MKLINIGKEKRRRNWDMTAHLWERYALELENRNAKSFNVRH